MGHASLTPAAFGIAAAGLLLSPAAAQSTERASVDSAGVQANRESGLPAISADGLFVAFFSDATNLVPGDTNGQWDVFVHERLTGQTRRVSVDSAAVQGNRESYEPAISPDGRYVVFLSRATNLVPGDTNGSQDVFLHDRQTGQTSRVSVDSAGAEGNLDSGSAAISADGRYVAFESDASNLVAGDTNASSDVFLRDLQTGQTTRVSVSAAGAQSNDWSYAPAISADGLCIAFYSAASNLVAGDTNLSHDVFVHERLTGAIGRVSVNSLGAQGNGLSYEPSLSADGSVVAFHSIASNLVPADTNNNYDVFVHDRQTALTSRVSVDSAGAQQKRFSFDASLSGDGRLVTFWSFSGRLVSGDTNRFWDSFLHDRQTGVTSRISLDSAGVQGNNGSMLPAISPDGRYVAFQSNASDLVAGDNNGVTDVFVRDLGAGGAPTLTASGVCPGAITLTIGNATASGSVAILHGPAGVFVKPTAPCQGLILGVSPPTLATMATANGSGAVILNFNAPAGLCGRSVQAVDVSTCLPTNVVVL